MGNKQRGYRKCKGCDQNVKIRMKVQDDVQIVTETRCEVLDISVTFIGKNDEESEFLDVSRSIRM